MSKRAVLITTSIAVHGAIATALVISGVWSMERLDPEKLTVSLAVMLPPPPAPSGSPAGADAKITPKPKTITKAMTQPVVTIDKTPPTKAVAPVPGNGLGTTTGQGDNPDGKPDDIGSCVGIACGPSVSKTAPQPEIKIPPPQQPIKMPPSMLKALRTGGNTQLVPSDVIKQQMVREDHLTVEGTNLVCLDGRGAISSISQVQSTGYPAYDQVIANGMRGWTYRPYTIDGVGMPICAKATIVYSIK